MIPLLKGISGKLRVIASRRPLVALTVSTSVGGISYLGYLEWSSASSAASSNQLSSIPRDCYDVHAIQKYWEARPISAVRRVIRIACELSPVACEYVYKFHLWPRMVNNLNSLTGHYYQSSMKNESRCESTEILSNKLFDVSISSQEKDYQERNLARKLRRALTNLGPTFIKVGQQLSIRPDLVSPIVLYELQRLCDAVPPFECSIAMRVLADELESTRRTGLKQNKKRNNEDVKSIISKVFDEMPTLVASASLGQVYKAKLRPVDEKSEPECVAIKIQRPDILQTVTLDLFLMVTYGKFVDKICSFLTNQIPYHEAFLNGFSKGAFMELNYLHEAENQTFFRNEIHSRFSGPKPQWSFIRGKLSQFGRSLFRVHRDRDGDPAKVIVPKVYSEYTTERILVTEWINGKPLAQAPPEQIRELIPVGVELFLCQLLDIGKFHADPHPGNLYVTTSKCGIPMLCLLDFGLVAHVDEQARNSMTNAIVNLLQGDYDTLISLDAKQLGFLPYDMDVTDLRPVLKKVLKSGLVESGSNLHDRRRNLMAISNELNVVFFEYPFSVPPFFALVTRGLGLLEGIALSGDPSFDIFKAAYPYAKKRAVETLKGLWKDFS
ncbi:hypothetical protein HJC23_000277 [Cyclotella cryptica]|uniref:ABC1 atypical kinase-like domain-containing protein n=1 Tax=Cyclotella cryptica TaxID=29204 RepID=A0ABD3QCB6_9STRA|eukprot:CCRYP_006855-RB/>CCRYP_006855-RB protein AED:0.20 eAED:0.20 QI:101/1/1/1/0.66/0.5/4/1395/608